MRRLLILVILLVMTLASSCVGSDVAVPEKANVMRQEIIADLTDNILPFWIHYSFDPSGGFYGIVGRDGTGRPEAQKGGVMNARILWTFSKAYELYGDIHYLMVADRAQREFLEKFIDHEDGGVYWQTGPDGVPSDSTKRTFAMAYGIYGLVAHHKATGSMKSLEAAIALYCTLEDKVRDKEVDGYIEAYNSDFTELIGDRTDSGQETFKTMNTHIHIVEAYTQLYKVWAHKGLEERLKAVVEMLTDKIFDTETGHLNHYFDRSWDKSGGTVVSYGHDIETAWLLTEAAQACGDDALVRKCREVSLRLVDTAIEEGFNHDKGYMMYESRGGALRDHASWWCQCETVTGCVDAWQMTGDEAYLDVAYQTWDFIKANFIDKEYGEWFRTVRADGSPNVREAKASVWNCPYHNSRLGFEMEVRLR